MDETTMQPLERDIAAMAKQFALSVSEVHAILCEVRHLERAARIRDFLPLLAMKHVKDVLRRKSTDQPVDTADVRSESGFS